MDKKYMSLVALSRATGLPAAWLRREADAGRIPCIRVGRVRMFDLNAVVKSLDKRQEVGGDRHAS